MVFALSVFPHGIILIFISGNTDSKSKYFLFESIRTTTSVCLDATLNAEFSNLLTEFTVDTLEGSGLCR